MDGRILEHEIALRRLLFKWLRDRCGRPDLLGKRVSDIRQRIAGAAGDNELTLLEESIRLVPLRNVAKSIHADEKRYLIGLAQGLLQAAHGVDRIVRRSREARAPDFVTRELGRSFQQRWHESLFGGGSQHNHRVAMGKRG